jgi:hypothetical protein
VAAAVRSGRKSGCRRHRRDLRPPGLTGTEIQIGEGKSKRTREVPPNTLTAKICAWARRAQVQTLSTVDRAKLAHIGSPGNSSPYTAAILYFCTQPISYLAFISHSMGHKSRRRAHFLYVSIIERTATATTGVFDHQKPRVSRLLHK